MQQFNIYLSGGMQIFGKDNFDEGNEWRIYCKDILENCDSIYKVNVINPNSYFNFKDGVPYGITEEAVMRFDLHKLRSSNLVIVNFNDPKSIGTQSEMAIAYDRNIPIIGHNKHCTKLHPWQHAMCEHIFVDMDDLIDFIEDFYLR